MVTMEELLASQKTKITPLFRGQNIEGTVISIDPRDIILDLGGKTDGILNKREIPQDEVGNLKLGDKLTAYVVVAENESGQAILSLNVPAPKIQTRGKKTLFSKFINAHRQNLNLLARIIEANKGGLMVEVLGVRGFLPSSQMGSSVLSAIGGNMQDTEGKEVRVKVLEIDEKNNRLIFKDTGLQDERLVKQLKEFKSGQKVVGEVLGALSFGLAVNVAGMMAFVPVSEVFWERVDNLQDQFKKGQQIDAVIYEVDEVLGKLNLSIKRATEDPFLKLAQNYPADEVVKGEITEVTEAGVAVGLEDGVEGFLPASKMKSDTVYEVGKSITLLVDSVDTQRRRVNLAPFISTTAGLIYK